MSHNQSRGEKSEAQSRKPGRSGVAGQQRVFSGGGAGKGGGGGFAPPVPAPAPSSAANTSSVAASGSFKKPGNGQGGQPRGLPTASPQVGVTAYSPSAREVGNGPQSQPPLQVPGTVDSSVLSASKLVDLSAPKPSRAVPRPPTSQSLSGPLDPTTPAMVMKGDATKPFTLQFGSISPGFVNGMQIPARTSSAPPNLDEQKKDQASHGMYGASASTIPPSYVSKQQLHPPKKDAIGSFQANSGNSRPLPEAKKDNSIQKLTPISISSQKSSGLAVPGISMPMFQQQVPMPLQFAGPNLPMQSQHVSAGPLQMPVAQMPMGNSPQMFVPGLQPHIVHQGQGIGFATRMGHHVASTMGSVGMGIGTQYSQHQAGQFGGSRKTAVKITHPVTHEELKLDKKPDSYTDPSGQRSNLPPQTQPPAFPTPQINFFQTSQAAYAAGLYYPPLPLSNAQPTVSQPPRFNFPVAQSGTPVSIVNPSTLTSVSVSKSGLTIHKDSEESHLGYSLGGSVLPVSASAPVQVTVKPAVIVATEKAGTPSAGFSAVVIKDGGLKLAKPLQDAGFIHQQRGSEVGLEVSQGQLNYSANSILAAPIPTDNHLPAAALSVVSHQKTEFCASTPASTLVIQPVSSPSHTSNDKKELLSSDSFKDNKTKPDIMDQRHLQQERMADILDSSSYSNVLSPKLHNKSYSSLSSDRHIPENFEHINPLSKTNEVPAGSCASPIAEHDSSSEAGAIEIKSDKAHITADILAIPEVKDALKDTCDILLSPCLIIDGGISRNEPTTNILDAEVSCQEDITQLDVRQQQETGKVAESLESEAYDDSSLDDYEGKRDLVSSLAKPFHNKDLIEEVTDVEISKKMVAPEHLHADHNLKSANGEMAGCRLENNGALEEVGKANMKSLSSIDSDIYSSSNLSVLEAKLSVIEDPTPKTGSLLDINVPTVNSPRSLHLAVVSDSEFSDKSQKVDEKAIETGSQVSHSSLMVKDRLSFEANRTKNTTGKRKKKKEMLSRADATGMNSDLYMAYKGPEEQQIASVSADGTDSSSVVDGNKLQADGMVKDIITKEDGHCKTDIDDWEDAVEISSPKLEASEKSGQHPMARKVGYEFGGSINSKKKYSRNFLLTFSDQYTDLPIGFEIGGDIAPLLNVQKGTSHLVNSELLSGHARIIDRPNPSNRRMMIHTDDEKWAKTANLLPSSREVGHGAGAGFRAEGATSGVLRNPRGQGGILSGQMQPFTAQGVPRNNVDADRWQRASGPQRGLIPSPQTPAQVMHKAEEKYVVGKVSDEEEAKQRQLKGILNKLTPQNFDRLFQKVKEVNIDSAATLTGVISQIFDKALMEPTFCEMYANFCFHLAGELPDFNEDNEKITFKRLLLSKCQDEFERGEREQAEADKVEEEGEVKQSEEAKEEKRIRARRRMLGNIRLIGELYKKKMLTERIMHECIKKLLGQNQNPDEEDIESLCKLMSTIGEMIDHAKAKEHMDAYFDIMKNLSMNQKLSSRLRFMLKDAIDLRKNNWQQRRKVEGPKRIDEVHRDAAQERAQAGRSARGSGMGSSARRGPPPSDYASRASMPLSSPGAQQAANLRSIPTQVRGHGSQDVRMEDKHAHESRTLSATLSQRSMGDDAITLGPQGGLAKGMSSRGQPLMPSPPIADISSITGETRRTALGPNGHGSISDRNAYLGIRELGKTERISDRLSNKTSVDQVLGSAGSSGASQYVSFSEEQLREKSISAIREYYSAKDEKEVGLCIKELKSPSFYPAMVSLWVTDSFERKDIERELLSTLIVSLCKSGDRLLSQAQLIQGFELVLSSLEDAVNDAPRAAEFLGRIFVRTILEDVLSFREIGRLIHEGGEEPGRLLEIGLAADLLGSVLEIVRTEIGDATVNELRTSSNLTLESFRPPHPMKSRKLEQFL